MSLASEGSDGEVEVEIDVNEHISRDMAGKPDEKVLNSSSSLLDVSNGISSTTHSGKDEHLPEGSATAEKKRLTLLELPMDILKEIIKEVCAYYLCLTRTNTVLSTVRLTITSR